LRERWQNWVEETPTHRWIARMVFPIFLMQRLTQVVSNDTFDSLMIGYLWWLSEVTAHESWLGRKEAEKS
jgi:hypothetical protein